ncbi:MAG: hypothetical protein RL308_1616 [Bacteroidota bacterium]|jgi:hypothetical protein
MKKLITICLLIAATCSVKAQTKEETISWLKEKLTTCLKVPYPSQSIEIISITECELVIRHNMNFIVEGKVFIQYKIPTSSIIIGYRIKNKFETIEYVDTWHHEDGKSSTISDAIYLANTEEKIYERLQKAFDHLATFCPKKKETF